MQICNTVSRSLLTSWGIIKMDTLPLLTIILSSCRSNPLSGTLHHVSCHFATGTSLDRSTPISSKTPLTATHLLGEYICPTISNPNCNSPYVVQIHVAFAGAVAHLCCFGSCALPLLLLPSPFVMLLQVQKSDPVSCSAGGVEAAFDKVNLLATRAHQTSARSLLFSCILSISEHPRNVMVCVSFKRFYWGKGLPYL